MDRRQFLASTSIGMMLASPTITNALASNMTAPSSEDCRIMPMKIDSDPLENEFAKYPSCPYCGMARKMWSQTRHLVQYEDDNTEGTCSIHCLALSLSLNMDRGPKKIWVGDAGSDADVKPLIAVEDAIYALQSDKPGTMTARRKWAFSNKVRAEATGGELVAFEGALKAAYSDMAADTLRIRKRRAEKKARKAKQMNK